MNQTKKLAHPNPESISFKSYYKRAANWSMHLQ